jgi:hypothetical protein
MTFRGPLISNAPRAAHGADSPIQTDLPLTVLISVLIPNDFYRHPPAPPKGPETIFPNFALGYVAPPATTQVFRGPLLNRAPAAPHTPEFIFPNLVIQGGSFYPAGVVWLDPAPPITTHSPEFAFPNLLPELLAPPPLPPSQLLIPYDFNRHPPVTTHTPEFIFPNVILPAVQINQAFRPYDFYRHPPAPPKGPEFIFPNVILLAVQLNPAFQPFDFYRHPPAPPKGPEFIFPNIALAFQPGANELVRFRGAMVLDARSAPPPPKGPEFIFPQNVAQLGTFVFNKLLVPYDFNRHPPAPPKGPEFIFPNVVLHAPPGLYLSLVPYDFDRHNPPPPHPVEWVFVNYLAKMLPGIVVIPPEHFIRNAAPILTEIRQEDYTLQVIRVSKPILDQ